MTLTIALISMYAIQNALPHTTRTAIYMTYLKENMSEKQVTEILKLDEPAIFSGNLRSCTKQIPLTDRGYVTILYRFSNDNTLLLSNIKLFNSKNENIASFPRRE